MATLPMPRDDNAPTLLGMLENLVPLAAHALVFKHCAYAARRARWSPAAMANTMSPRTTL